MKIKNIYLGLIVVMSALAIAIIIMTNTNVSTHNNKEVENNLATANVISQSFLNNFAPINDVFRDDKVYFNITQEPNPGNNNILKFKVSEPGRLIWKKAYISDSDDDFTLINGVKSSKGTNIGTNWILGEAIFTIPLNESFNGEQLILSYSCILENNDWKCGCLDSDCEEQNWTASTYEINLIDEIQDCDSSSVFNTKCIGKTLYKCVGDFNSNYYHWYPVESCNNCMDNTGGVNAYCDEYQSTSECDSNRDIGNFCKDSTIFECKKEENNHHVAYPIDFLTSGCPSRINEDTIDKSFIDIDSYDKDLNCFGNSLFLTLNHNNTWSHVSYCLNGCNRTSNECLDKTCTDEPGCNENSLGNKTCQAYNGNTNGASATCVLDSEGCYSWKVEPCNSNGCDTNTNECVGESITCNTNECVLDDACIPKNTTYDEKFCDDGYWVTCNLANNCTSTTDNYYCSYNKTQTKWLWTNYKPQQCECQSDTGCNSTTRGYLICNQTSQKTYLCKQEANSDCYKWTLNDICFNNLGISCYLKNENIGYLCGCTIGIIRNSTTEELNNGDQICNSTHNWVTCDSSNECEEIQGKYCDSGNWVSCDIGTDCSSSCKNIIYYKTNNAVNWPDSNIVVDETISKECPNSDDCVNNLGTCFSSGSIMGEFYLCVNQVWNICLSGNECNSSGDHYCLYDPDKVGSKSYWEQNSVEPRSCACPDECTLNEKKCSDDGKTSLICSQGDTCNEWVTNEDCDANDQVCNPSDYSCVECIIDNDCSPYTDSTNQNHLKKCVNNNCECNNDLTIPETYTCYVDCNQCVSGTSCLGNIVVDSGTIGYCRSSN